MALNTSPILRPMAPGRLSLLHVVLIILFGLAVLIPGTLPSIRPLSAHEVLAAQPAKEMLRDGHWIVQTYAGVPRYEKPPTTGWLIAASMSLFNSQSEWVVRLPAVLSGIAAALLVAMLAARWMGSTVGLFAALIQLSSYWVLKQATLAEADMPLTAAITAAFTLFALANVEHPHPRGGTLDRPWIRRAFMLAVGLAFLFKGPVALLFIFSGCLLYIAVRRPWSAIRRVTSVFAPRKIVRPWWAIRRFYDCLCLYIAQRRLGSALRFFADPIGLILLAILLIAWPAAVIIADPAALKIWHQELTGYAGGETFGRSSRLRYFHDVPLMLLPWIGLLFVALVKMVQHRLYRLPLTLFLLSWFLPGMIILQLAAYKSAHYTFPLLPPASIAMAAGMIWWLRQQTTRPVFPQLTLAAVIAVIGIAGAVTIGLVAPGLPASIPAILILCCGGLIVATLLERAKRIGPEAIALFGTIALGIILTDLLILPNLPGTWARKDFAQRVNARVPAGQTLYLVDHATDESVWYLSPPLKRYDSLKRFSEAVELPAEGIYALVRERTLKKLEPPYQWQELDRVAEAKRSDTKQPESKLPVLIKLERAPATQPATTQAIEQ